MADAINNDAIMKRFLYREKISFEEYGKITMDKRTNVFAKSYAESLKNHLKGLSDAKIRMFRSELNKEVLNKSEEIIAQCDNYIKADKGMEALGLMYGALKYDSADQGFKDMVDAVKKAPKGEEPKDPKKEGEAPGTDASKATKKPDEKKEPTASGAPAEDKGAKEVGPAAPKAPTAPPEKAPQAGLFASKKEATKFLNNLDHTLANINANEFEVIDATYTRYKRFMGSKYEVKFEEDVAIDENKFREIVTDTDQSSVSVLGDNRTGKPWVHIKISIPEPPEDKKDEKGNYLEYKVKRKDEYGRSFSDMKWVRGMGFMPCSTGKVFKEITTTKICRKYLDGDNAGKVVVKVEKEEVK